MKTRWILLSLGIGLSSWAQDASSTNDAASPTPVYRCLFLIDASSGMSRPKSITADTVSKLILNSVGGRLRPGDAWNLWTFDDQLRTNVIEAQTWDPRQRREVATRVYRLLDDLRYSKKKALFDRALSAASEEARRSGSLMVFLFTDGSKPLKGTPFDGPINRIFSSHASEMQKANKPFVTVLIARDGKFVTNAVSPGGESIYVPRLADAEAPPRAKPQKKDEAVTPLVVAPLPPPRKPLTVEEIAAALQPRKTPTNAAAVAPPPPVAEITNSQEVVKNEASKPRADAAVPALDLSSLPVFVASNLPAPSGAISNALLAVPSAARTGDAPGTQAVPNRVTPEPVSKTTIIPAPQKEEQIVETPPAATVEQGDDISASPQEAVLLQPEPASNAWKYLAAAAALLVTALSLALIYIRNIRYVPRPSLISRGMDRDKK